MRNRFKYKPELLFASFDIDGHRETGKIVEDGDVTIRVWFRGRIIQRHKEKHGVRRAAIFEPGFVYWGESGEWQEKRRRGRMAMRFHPLASLKNKQKIKKNRKQKRTEFSKKRRDTSGASSSA